MNAGFQRAEAARNVGRFGTSHPYLMDCVRRSRCFEVVGVLVTRDGVIMPPPLRPRIPSVAG